MAKSIDESVPSLEGVSGGPTGLFKRIRGALFEDSGAPGERFLKESSAASSETSESEFESVALGGLREILIRETGPALAEFTSSSPRPNRLCRTQRRGYASRCRCSIKRE
jgi:hypothetical protein